MNAALLQNRLYTLRAFQDQVRRFKDDPDLGKRKRATAFRRYIRIVNKEIREMGK